VAAISHQKSPTTAAACAVADTVGPPHMWRLSRGLVRGPASLDPSYGVTFSLNRIFN
jgi:hypothetical protein